MLVVGIHERVDSGPGRGTLYNTLLTFDEMGALANAHRKLVPTYTERLLWGQGDGKSLVATPTGVAGRVGGLICWEHWMPLYEVQITVLKPFPGTPLCERLLRAGLHEVSRSL